MMGKDSSRPASEFAEQPSKDEVAQEMARQYYAGDPALLEVIRIIHPGKEEDPREPIKLLEVNDDAIPSGVILPIGFPPHRPSGMYYPTEIIQIAPEELEKVRNQELPFPDGWVLDIHYDRSGEPLNVER